MRKRYRVLLLAAVVAAVVVPVGFALSLESQPVTVQMVPVIVHTASPTAGPPTLARTASSADPWGPVTDGAKLFIAGTMLFGLAAAVRRAA